MESREITPFNPLKILRYAEHVKESLDSHPGYPISVELDLSNKCNHNCSWCSYNGFRQDNWLTFPTDRLMALLDELSECGVLSITLTGGGEPLVHPDRELIMGRMAALGFQFGVVTNGRLLQGKTAECVAKYAKFVRISLDAGTQQTHQLLHGTAWPEFELILDNIREVRKHSPAITIGASFCVFDVNCEEIELAAKLVKAAGANYLEVRPVLPTEWRGGGFANPLTDAHVLLARKSLEEARQTHNSDGFQVIGMISRFNAVGKCGKDYQKCRIAPLSTVINADGKVYHCCQMRGIPEFAVGSIFTHTFKQVWDHPSHLSLIDNINLDKCPPCRYDGQNRIIERAIIGDETHSAFL